MKMAAEAAKAQLLQEQQQLQATSDELAKDKMDLSAQVQQLSGSVTAITLQLEETKHSSENKQKRIQLLMQQIKVVVLIFLAFFLTFFDLFFNLFFKTGFERRKARI